MQKMSRGAFTPSAYYITRTSSDAAPVTQELDRSTYASPKLHMLALPVCFEAYVVTLLSRMYRVVYYIVA